MIRILFVDDDNERARELTAMLDEYCIQHMSDYATSRDTALRLLSCNQYDLVVVDIILPDNMAKVSLSKYAGKDILNDICYDRKIITPLYVLGITSDNDTYNAVKDFFDSKFVPLTMWEIDNTFWKEHFISKIKYIEKLSNKYKPVNVNKADVVIIATVDDEYRALNSLPIEWEDYIIDNEPLICSKSVIRIFDNDKTVFRVKLPEMGMSAASHTTTKIIDLFEPDTIVMTGICGGNKDEVGLGDIIVAEKTWDYGSGKIKKDENGEAVLSIAPNQINIDSKLKIEIERTTEIVNDLSVSWNKNRNDNKVSRVKIGALASGSSVLANIDIIKNIKDTQFRKLLGIDMETYGVYFACANQGKDIKYVSIKAVSDLADEHKDDSYHEYSSSISAMYIYELIKRDVL